MSWFLSGFNLVEYQDRKEFIFIFGSTTGAEEKTAGFYFETVGRGFKLPIRDFTTCLRQMITNLEENIGDEDIEDKRELMF